MFFNIFLFCLKWYSETLSYIVYRKEQSKTRGKKRKKIGREYNQISQIIKKKCYLQTHLNCQLQEVFQYQ